MIRLHVVKSNAESDVVVHLGTFNVDAPDERLARGVIQSLWMDFNTDPNTSGFDDDFRDYAQAHSQGRVIAEPIDDTPTFDVGEFTPRKTEIKS